MAENDGFVPTDGGIYVPTEKSKDPEQLMGLANQYLNSMLQNPNLADGILKPEGMQAIVGDCWHLAELMLNKRDSL